ncbi:MAG: hypothetical protein AAFO69_10825, partial [Bacteroidota bacterium]
MMLTSLIIDDEYLARRRVEKLLEGHSDIKILGEAKNGQEAVELIHRGNKTEREHFTGLAMKLKTSSSCWKRAVELLPCRFWTDAN